jgi:hypothetical protein
MRRKKMRRVMTVMMLAVLLLALAAATAVAVTKTCSGNPCFGTNNRDWLAERVGDDLDDTIYGKAKGDTISANDWTDDADELFGNKGNDKLFTNDGDEEDIVHGGSGTDTCVVDESTTTPGQPGDSVSGCERVVLADPGVGPASASS